MPTTFRFLTRLAILGAIFAGVIYALATYIEPTPEPVSVRISPERFAE
ncbi:MAG: histidine kinase [Rhizobiales bacterium]|nr:histidine kinase [Hyphomicrobiales bacterium]MBO6699869.1 histidine kinase [Hyphomicrobiales bacterium]MBO6737407.1 histidine kinase [Hyphomicrobiales bacterium]MBO6911519.1 histidine kinase [Hyphomicrobiales bacterium]MBO6955181.1 histidine kinase [Hyphomicrobiales bacterium]